jgi:predicted Zn-dependent peptidase
LRLLSVVVGENMSSRLFQSMRERLGLCYSVNSGVEFVAETGAFTVQADLEPAKVSRALEVMRREFDRFAERALSARELRDAKEYTIGQAIIAAESTTHHAMALGEGLLGVGRCVVTDELVDRIAAVTAEEVRDAAAQLFCDDASALAVVGPERTW